MSIEEQKINILLHALKERYEAMHIIRKRVQDFCIWVLGILSSFAGIIFKVDINFNIGEKIIYSLAIFIIFIVVRFLYLADLNKGFKSQQKVAVKIEKIIGLLEDNFIEGYDSVYPKKWENSGNKKCEGNYFKSSHYLLYLGFLFILLAIWFANLM